MTLTTNLGYPRIGPDRELKRATEAYWKGELGADELREAALGEPQPSRSPS